MHTPPLSGLPCSPYPPRVGLSQEASTVEGLSLTMENIAAIASRIKALRYWNDPGTRDVTIPLGDDASRYFKVDRNAKGEFELGTVHQIRDKEEYALIIEIIGEMNAPQ